MVRTSENGNRSLHYTQILQMSTELVEQLKFYLCLNRSGKCTQGNDSGVNPTRECYKMGIQLTGSGYESVILRNRMFVGDMMTVQWQYAKSC